MSTTTFTAGERETEAQQAGLREPRTETVVPLEVICVPRAGGPCPHWPSAFLSLEWACVNVPAFISSARNSPGSPQGPGKCHAEGHCGWVGLGTGLQALAPSLLLPPGRGSAPRFLVPTDTCSGPPILSPPRTAHRAVGCPCERPEEEGMTAGLLDVGFPVSAPPPSSGLRLERPPPPAIQRGLVPPPPRLPPAARAGLPR